MKERSVQAIKQSSGQGIRTAGARWKEGMLRTNYTNPDERMNPIEDSKSRTSDLCLRTFVRRAVLSLTTG